MRMGMRMIWMGVLFGDGDEGRPKKPKLEGGWCSSWMREILLREGGYMLHAY